MASADTAQVDTVLGRDTGLDGATTAAVWRLLSEALGGLGLDGDKVTGKLAGGGSLSDALDVPPATTAVLYERAHHWFAAGRYDRAEQLFRALCTLAPTVVDHWLGYGICLRVSDASKEARFAFETAAALEPSRAATQFHLLDLDMAERDWTGAEARLAAFDRLTTAETPSDMLVEVDRYRRALELHRAEPSGGGG